MPTTSPRSIRGPQHTPAVLFGVFRTVDLGQQYKKVSRVGGNFSFDIDTSFVIIIIRCITLGLIYSS
jgi:hypothetical protein